LGAIDLQKQLARCRLRTARQRRRGLRPLAPDLRQIACDRGHDALPRPLQEQDEQCREGDDLELPGRALGDQRQIILHAVLEQRDDGGADDPAEQAAGAADHRHHQIFDAHAGIERTRADEAAHMRVEPAGERGQECRDHEGHELDPERVDAEALDQRVAAAQRPHGAAEPRVQEIVAEQEHQGDDAPDQVIDLCAGDQRERAEADRRDRRDAVEAAEPIDIAEQEADRKAPCHGRQRQEMALQAQGDDAEDGRDTAGQDHAKQQAEPGRLPVQGRDPCRRIG
ncbi:hypothetical protein chiPu_0029607, partial [Chiloscyllium punctatum]|nr:hypothetical protein [Chiloscyllium punctatum]